MPSRLVLDKLDLNLPPLTTWLVIIIVVVVGGSGRGARALDASLGAAIAVAQVVLVGGRVGLILVGDFARHCESSKSKSSEQLADYDALGCGDVPLQDGVF